MGIPSLLLFLNASIFATSVIILYRAFPHRHLRAMRYLILLTTTFCLVSFCVLNIYTLQSLDQKIFFSRMRYLGLSILGPSWLYFVCAIYEKWEFLHRRIVQAIIFLPAAITWVVCLVPSLNYLIQAEIFPATILGVSVVQFKTGAWFPFHMLWSCALVTSTLFLGIWIFLHGKRLQRKQVLILAVGCAVSAGVDLYCVVTNSPMRWLMVSSATFIFNQLAVIYAAFRHRLLDVAPYALEKIFQDIPDPVLVEDHQGRLRAYNRAAEKLFNIQIGSISKKTETLIPNFSSSPGDFRFQDTHRRERFFVLELKNLNVDQDSTAGRIIFFREITVQKAVEKQLHANLEFKARLLSLIAHDLSGNIKNQVLLSSVLEKQTSPENRDLIDMLVDSASASQDLMSNILVWAKTQEGQFQPVKKPFEIHTLVKECLESLEVSIRLKGLRVEVQNTAGPRILDGDSEMIASVIRNLLSNSIRFTQSGKKIRVAITSETDQVKLEVQDEGSGMSKEQLTAVLNPSGISFRGVTHAQSGYGIGLSIVKKFIDLHGGNFSISSTLETGTNAYFTLPCR